jgi:hypothetical protein
MNPDSGYYTGKQAIRLGHNNTEGLTVWKIISVFTNLSRFIPHNPPTCHMQLSTVLIRLVKNNDPCTMNCCSLDIGHWEKNWQRVTKANLTNYWTIKTPEFSAITPSGFSGLLLLPEEVHLASCFTTKKIHDCTLKFEYRDQSSVFLRNERAPLHDRTVDCESQVTGSLFQTKTKLWFMLVILWKWDTCADV